MSRGPRSFALVICVALAFTLAPPRAADACSCLQPGPPCQEYWRADAVFAGRVTAIDPVPDPGWSPDSAPFYALPMSRRVTFAIVEGFRGVTGKSVEVFTGSGGGDCGYDFEVGRAYVVYATRMPRTATGEIAKDARLHTGICSRTSPIGRTEADARRVPPGNADEDLAYARSIASSAPTGGTITGNVKRIEYSLTEGQTLAPVPMAGVRIVFEGAETTWDAISDDGGRFTVGGLPAGRYRVTAFAPDRDYVNVYPSATAEILNARACADVSVIVRADGRISGRLVDRAGRAVPGATLELLAPSRADRGDGGVGLDHRVLSGPDGVFHFVRVPPGDYLVAIHGRLGPGGQPIYPRLLFPGVRAVSGATVLHLASGSRLAIPDFVLPDDYALRSVSGRVVSPDGLAAEGAKVYVRSAAGYDYLSVPVLTDADGRFTVSVLAGQRYVLIGEQQAGTAERPAYDRGELPIDDAIIAKGGLEIQLSRPIR